MKYYIHIPKLLEIALNVVCDDVTLRGKQCLVSPIPYPLYLRCILTYAYKYYARRYYTYRFYRDIRHKVDVSVRIGCLYPNVLDHVVLDDDDVDAELITQVAQSHLVDDAAASIQRFASRCLAANKSEMMVNALSQVIMKPQVIMIQTLDMLPEFPKPIVDVLLFYGAKLDPNYEYYLYFNQACLLGMNDVVKQAIENRHRTASHYDVKSAVISGNCDTIKLVFGAYRDSINVLDISLHNATVQSMELCMSLNIVRRGERFGFYNIPSFSVLQWILDHDVMEHDVMLIDIARNAAYYSGHYFDMLIYLIEQRNFTVPRDILIRIEPSQATDLDVADYLLLHGADVNADDRWNVLQLSPMLLRYWIDKGLVVKPNDAKALIQCILQGMTAPVLEMMIDKYSMDVNAIYVFGHTVLHEACRCNKFEIVEMLIQHGADVNKRYSSGQTPFDLTDDDRIKQLMISFGYKANQ